MLCKDQERREDLSLLLRGCAAALRDGKHSGKPLRELQRHAQKVTAITTDPYLRTIVFVLDQWIKDYFFNFAGDIVSPVWSAIEGVRARLLSNDTSKALTQLADALSDDSPGALGAIQNLVCTYLEAIAEANTLIKTSVRKIGNA